MNEPPSTAGIETPQQPPPQRGPVLSLARLRSAFAKMLGPSSGASSGLPAGAGDAAAPAPREWDGVSPRAIVEGLLFVGRDDGSALEASEIASTMRDVTPEEVDAAIDELNALYLREESPCAIVRSAAGYRIELRPAHARLLNGGPAEHHAPRLSPAAVEVLSMIAYRQPITVAALDELRGKRCGRLVTTLVRRGLVRRTRGEGNAAGTLATTERFLEGLGLTGIEQLPRVAELDD
ncbi:MAG: SMC-Scp complex subunit ScpB [Lacipirellulaceae bacterium]